MPEKTTRKIIASLLESQITGVLATEKEHQPYTNLIAFSFSDDLKKIIFATLNNTTKFRNLTDNPQVSMLIDNRKNDCKDFSGSAAITALGTCVELTGKMKGQMLLNHLKRLPGLKNFLKAETIAVFGIEVRKYIIVKGLENTIVFTP